MKSLQNKLLILIVSSTLITAMVVMAIALSNYGRILKNDSEKIRQLMCSAEQIALCTKIKNRKRRNVIQLIFNK